MDDHSQCSSHHAENSRIESLSDGDTSSSSLERTLNSVSAKMVQGLKLDFNNFSLKKSISEGKVLIGSINESEEYIS